jgi:hypothetical protein
VGRDDLDSLVDFVNGSVDVAKGTLREALGEGMACAEPKHENKNECDYSEPGDGLYRHEFSLTEFENVSPGTATTSRAMPYFGHWVKLTSGEGIRCSAWYGHAQRISCPGGQEVRT